MSLFEANRYYERVEQIPVPLLVEGNVRCVLVDRDNTLLPRSTWVAPPEALAWLDEVRAAGISLCMVSNNFHGSEVDADAARLGMPAVHHAMKPAPFAVHVALARMGVPAEQAVLVGDQVFTDVLAGNLAGVRTILVRPQSRRDLWYTQLFRVGERLVLRDREYEGDD